MKKNLIRSILFIGISVLLFTMNNNKLLSQWAIMNTEADSIIRKGTYHIYNVQFDSASRCFHEVMKLYPNNPAGYFLDGMVEWWKISMYRNTEKYDAKFLEKMQKVIDLCDLLIDTNQADIGALFFKGGALGYRGRFYALREDWLNAAGDGKAGFDILIRCLKLAPGNHDIMLGTGIYNYFAEAIPEMYPLIQPLLVFLPRGDKKLGIMQLEAASRNARYAATEAKVVLLQVYYSFEKNYYPALKISQELTQDYPMNPYFHRYLGRCYVVNGMYDMMDTTWREILMRCINKQTGYDYMTAREALYYVGVSLMKKNQLDMSLKYFYKADEACRNLDKQGPSGFMVQTNVQIGKIYDLQGKRDLAIKQYKKVLSWKDNQNSHKESSQYLDKPYKK
jgi:tetratricopeptide (TPR) repeat protein